MTDLPRIDPEFRGLIPALGAEEYALLEESIVSERRCRNAIILWKGVIVDGHNRYAICMAHGIRFEYEEREFADREEAKLWILDNQLGRRNLTDAARIEVVLKKEVMLRERAKKRLSLSGGDKKSSNYANGSGYPKSSTPDSMYVLDELASQANVGRGSLHRYLQLKKHAPPALLEAVTSGGMKIGTAFRLLPKEIAKQLAKVREHYATIEKNLLKVKDPNALRDIQARLAGLKEMEEILCLTH
jgi:hypothetical protein